jgi:hypothetical protein
MLLVVVVVRCCSGDGDGDDGGGGGSSIRHKERVGLFTDYRNMLREVVCVLSVLFKAAVSSKLLYSLSCVK